MAQIRSSVPKWVIVGIERPTGVMLIASTKMTQVELQSHIETFDIDFYGSTVAGMTSYHLSAEMTSCVVVNGADWKDAMSKLFGTWAPNGEGPLGLPSGTPALSAQRSP